MLTVRLLELHQLLSLTAEYLFGETRHCRFNERAAEAEANRGSIDFSEQVETMRKILAEAKLSH